MISTLVFAEDAEITKVENTYVVKDKSGNVISKAYKLIESETEYNQ